MKKIFALFIFVVVLSLSFASVEGAVYKKPVRSSVSVFGKNVDKGVCPSCVSKKASAGLPVKKKFAVEKAQLLPRCEDISRFYPGKHYMKDCALCPGYACDGPLKLAVAQGGRLMGYVKCFDCKLRSEMKV